jgi:hypothetical protein
MLSTHKSGKGSTGPVSRGLRLGFLKLVSREVD